jgi:PAS domain S-box-containing protein
MMNDNDSKNLLVHQEMKERGVEPLDNSILPYFMEALIDSADDAIISKNLDSIITSWNRGAERIFGYTAEEMIGKTILTLIPPHLQSEEQTIIQKIRSGKRVEHYETVRRRKDGTLINISLTVSPIKDAAGRIVGASKIARDITNIYHTEQQLVEAKHALEKRSEELTASLSLLTATLESTADGIVVLDFTGKIVSYNSRFAAIWQFPDELLQRLDGREMREHAAQQLSNPEGFLQLVQKQLREPEVETFDVLELKDGRIFERYGFPQRVNQECMGVVINFREVTERKRVERALQLGEEKYRLLWATAGDAFVLFGRDNIIREANAAVTTIFGYQPEEVIGRDLSMLQPERLREGHRRGIQRYLETGARTLNWRAAQTLGLHRDGQEVPIEIAFNHLQLEGEDLFAGFIRDITERKNAETERAKLLAREQKAREEAETANRLKDEFLATLSHELRTPLNAIMGWSHMLTDNRLTEEAKEEGIEIIQRNAHHQAQLIDDILDVSRIITGKLTLDVRPVELAEVIEAAVQSVLPSAQAKGIRLQRVLDSGGSLVSGDPNRLQQIVWNLLTNAIKFTPKGGRVQARLECVNSHIEIIVADNGAGISPDVLPYIFERFRQADSTTTRQHGGLGLGLAIVRHLVEMHGGTVEVESAGLGQGSTFTVKLPLIAARSVELRTSSAEGRVHPIARRVPDIECPPELAGLHVLVVDDEEDTCRLIRTILERCEATVTTASSVAEALRALQDSPPNILLSDLGMPGEDGYSLIQKVRALSPEAGGQTPAAALTAYARVEDRMKVLRSGFQIHLTKPVEPAELITVVASLAGRHGV